jgi:tRNA (guanine-N7-)-methyltransferase
MRKFDDKKIAKNTPNHSPLPSGFIDSTKYLVLEIGAGTGMHPISYCQKNSEHQMIAIEKTSERFAKFKRQHGKSNLINLLPIHAHAVSWIAHNIKEEIVDKIFILYPNPNPKFQDLNKRWHAMPFFGYLIKILKPGGSIVIRTNERFYAEEANHFIKEVWNLENKQTSFKKEDVSNFKTLFEKKYLERSQTCYEVSCLKII